MCVCVCVCVCVELFNRDGAPAMAAADWLRAASVRPVRAPARRDWGVGGRGDVTAAHADWSLPGARPPDGRQMALTAASTTVLNGFEFHFSFD